jgi:hypothetical protein
VGRLHAADQVSGSIEKGVEIFDRQEGLAES